MAAHGIPIVARAAQTRDDPEMDFAELVSGSTPALADGAMGTLLFEYGLSFGEAPETWNLLHPELVRKVHRGYLEAGSQIVLTNTFGGNRSRLSMHNLEHRVPELNRTAAVRLSSGTRSSRLCIARRERLPPNVFVSTICEPASR
jgi:S-methylmethionine-dependent homocysteine/selenocysteine methylase